MSKCTTTRGTNHLLKLNFTLESVEKRFKEDMCVSGVNTNFFIFVFPLAKNCASFSGLSLKIGYQFSFVSSLTRVRV